MTRSRPLARLIARIEQSAIRFTTSLGITTVQQYKLTVLLMSVDLARAEFNKETRFMFNYWRYSQCLRHDCTSLHN